MYTHCFACRVPDAVLSYAEWVSCGVVVGRPITLSARWCVLYDLSALSRHFVSTNEGTNERTRSPDEVESLSGSQKSHAFYDLMYRSVVVDGQTDGPSRWWGNHGYRQGKWLWEGSCIDKTERVWVIACHCLYPSRFWTSISKYFRPFTRQSCARSHRHGSRVQHCDLYVFTVTDLTNSAPAWTSFFRNVSIILWTYIFLEPTRLCVIWTIPDVTSLKNMYSDTFFEIILSCQNEAAFWLVSLLVKVFVSLSAVRCCSKHLRHWSIAATWSTSEG